MPPPINKLATPLPIGRILAAYQEVIDRFGFSPLIEPGRMTLLSWDLEYVCGAALANFIDQILVRRLDDFIPDNDHPLILDCGANIGFTVLNYKRQFPQSRIIAFEPDPQFAPVLRRNLRNNGAEDVQVVEEAVWIRDEMVGWYCEGIDGSHIETDRRNAETQLVHAVDLGSYLTEEIDLLKMDIEGAEYEVVGRLGKKLQNVKNILIECHLGQANVTKLGKMLQILTKAGFKVSVNSFRAWRDLTRQSPIRSNHWEQYLLIAGWRSVPPGASTNETDLPYVGIQRELQSHKARIELLEVQKALEMTRAEAEQLRGSLESEEAQLEISQAQEAESNTRQQQLLKLIRAKFLNSKLSVSSKRLKSPFDHEGSLCWTSSLSSLGSDGDDEEHPSRSTLVLFEDEKLLGPAHCIHEDIRHLGSGRYSHWKNNLYFSTSDNTDPNTNGRKYILLFVKSARPEQK